MAEGYIQCVNSWLHVRKSPLPLAMLFPEDTVCELKGFWIVGLKEAFLLMPILAPEAFRSSCDGL